MILSSDIDSFSKSDIKYSMDVDSIKFVISLFNTVTGTDDRVTISMDVTNRREYRTGIVTIKTELNNLMHAELVHKVIALLIRRNRMDNTSLRKKLESIKGYLPSQYVDTILMNLTE